MSTVRTPCDTCGVVLVPAEDIVVSVAAHNTSGFYEFDCPQCETHQRHKTTLDTVSLLLEHGCPMMADSVPAEVREPREGVPIGYDDLIDFHDFVWDTHRFNAALDELDGIQRW